MRKIRSSQENTLLTPERAIAAAASNASALGLAVDDAIVLHASNRVTLRLMPCDIVARVAPMSFHPSVAFEVELAQRLAEAGGPVARLDPRVEPRVHVRDDLVMNLWTYHEPLGPQDVAPADYAHALRRLHDAMLQVDLSTPHFTDRIAEAQHLLENRDETPELGDATRELLSTTLRTLKRSIDERHPDEQLLHGEPHPGNLLMTQDGPVFVDLETSCRGPVEFDIAHAPEEVAERYPDADQRLVLQCRALAYAMVTTWRWDRNDRLPNRWEAERESLAQMRAALERC